MEFRKAERSQAKARMAFIGPSGSGKTYTALRLATILGGRIAVIDSERRVEQYANRFDFDILTLHTFPPSVYTEAIHAAEREKYDWIIIDSLSHAWSGQGGALEMADKAKAVQKNQFSAWRDVTPEHNKLVDALLLCQAHLICTLRVKTEYTLEENEKGKKVPVKVGLAPIQRAGMEYEFDLCADLDMDHQFHVWKTTYGPSLDGHVARPAGEATAELIRAELMSGKPAAPYVSPLDKARALIDAATTPTELDAILPQLKALNLTGEDQKQAVAHYTARQSSLKGAT